MHSMTSILSITRRGLELGDYEELRLGDQEDGAFRS